MQKMKSEKLTAMFEKMPNSSTLEVWNLEDNYGFEINWSEKGVGFGQLIIAIDKVTGEVRVDDEGMSPDSCGRFVERLGDTVVHLYTPPKNDEADGE